VSATATIGELFEFRKGKKPPKLLESEEPSAKPFYQIGELRGEVQPKFAIAPKGTEVLESDICLVWDGANAGTVGYGLNGIIGSTITRLRPKDSRLIYTPYVGRYLQSKFSFLNSSAQGAAIPHVDGEKLKNLQVNLPSLKEQKRIAAILDKADSLRRKRQQAIQLADQFLRAVFLDMFGSDTGVEIKGIGELCEVKGGKRLPKGADYASEKTEHPYLRVVDFKNLSIDKANLKYVTNDIHQKIKRYVITSEDVFISIAGTIGVVGTVDQELSGANLTENAAKLVIKDKHLLNNQFLAYWLSTPEAQRQIEQKTMLTSQPKLALFRIEELQMPVPPLEKQKEFLRVYESVQNNAHRLGDLSALSECLFNAVAQNEFSK